MIWPAGRRAAAIRRPRGSRAARCGRRSPGRRGRRWRTAGVAQAADVPPQDAHAERVERGDVRSALQPLAQHLADPLLHLGGRLVGERDGQNPLGARAVADQLGDAKRHHPGLARAGPGQHQQRAGERLDGFLLSSVEGGTHGQRSYHEIAATKGAGEYGESWARAPPCGPLGDREQARRDGRASGAPPWGLKCPCPAIDGFPVPLLYLRHVVVARLAAPRREWAHRLGPAPVRARPGPLADDSGFLGQASKASAVMPSGQGRIRQSSSGV